MNKASSQPRWVSPAPLNVAPALVGLPLASPARRALAMAVDLLVVALLSGVSGLWLVGGLVLVGVQLRSRRGGAARWQHVAGWVLAGLLLLLAGNEAIDRWQARGGRMAEAAPSTPPSTEPYTHWDDDADGPAGASQRAPGTSDAQRIAQLEAELADARKPQPLSLRKQIDRALKAVGVQFGWGFVYFSLLPAWWAGQTLGKRLFGLQVLELTGQPMTVMRCLKRYGGYAAGMATGGLGFLQLLWDPNRQGIQDRTAHTVVVDLRAPRQPDSSDTKSLAMDENPELSSQ